MCSVHARNSLYSLTHEMYLPGPKPLLYTCGMIRNITGLCGMVSFRHFVLLSKNEEMDSSEARESSLQHQVADELSGIIYSVHIIYMHIFKSFIVNCEFQHPPIPDRLIPISPPSTSTSSLSGSNSLSSPARQISKFLPLVFRPDAQGTFMQRCTMV